MAAVDGFAIPQTILRHFDLTSSPYTDLYAREVAERRRSFPGGLLFLDQLLGLAFVDGNALYPPTSPAGLRRLIHIIRSADIDRLKQDCFIYYLLLDSDHASNSPLINGDGRYRAEDGDANMEVMRVDNGKGRGKAKETGSAQAEEFANRRCLPQVWRGFIFGYWAMDHGLWEDAVQALSNPSITSLNFLPGIFTVLSLRVSPPASSLSLVHSLFTALSPPLDSDSLISLRAISLASASSLSNAFSFIRSQPPTEQTRLRETMYLWALGASRIPCGSGQSGVQGDVLTQLLHIPLQAEESTHLVDFLIHPPKSIPGPSLDLLHELVTVRLIHQGQYAECLALDKELAGSGVGKEEDRQKRRERVKEFISILPEAQRRVLQIDGEIRREELGTRRNDVVQKQTDVEMASSSAPKSRLENLGLPSGLAIPTPKRLPSLLSLAGESSAIRPSSPVPGRIMTPISRNVSSPFAGPPQFARTDSPGAPGTPGRGTPVQRLASGSPFILPARAVVDVPRPTRRIIDDDDDEEMNGDSDREVRKEARSMAPSAPSAQVPSPEEKEKDEADDMEVEDQPAEEQDKSEKEKEMPPPPIPSTSHPKPPARKSSRQTIAPKPRDPSPPPKPTSRSNRQGSTAPSEAESSTTDQKKNGEEIIGESGHIMPGSFLSSSSSSLSAPTAGRSRMTRSASRAVLDDEDHNSGPASKKARTKRAVPERQPSPTRSEVEGGKRNTRRGARELSVASSTGESRRGTRSSVTPGPGGRGASPTGSTISTRSRAGAREGSMTPRVTRTRK